MNGLTEILIVLAALLVVLVVLVVRSIRKTGAVLTKMFAEEETEENPYLEEWQNTQHSEQK